MGIGAALERNIFAVGSKAHFIGQRVAVRIIEHIGKIYGVLEVFINAYRNACGNIVFANRGSVFAAGSIAANLDKNHGVTRKVYISIFIIGKCADVNYRIFILRVKIAPNLLFNIGHFCGVTHKVFKRNCIEAVFIFGIIHKFRITIAILINKCRYSVKLFIGSDSCRHKVRRFYISYGTATHFSLPAAKKCIHFCTFVACKPFKVIKRKFKLICACRNSYFPEAIFIVIKCACRICSIAPSNAFGLCKFFRINLRAVLKLHRENAVVLRLFLHAADLDEDHCLIFGI